MDAAAKLGYMDILRSTLLKFRKRFLSPCAMYGSSIKNEA